MARQRVRFRKREGDFEDIETAPEGASSFDEARDEDQPETPEAAFGPINWVLAVMGVLLLAFGFVYLSDANAQGDNAAAYVAPYIIIGSYLMIFAAIVLRTRPSAKQ